VAAVGEATATAIEAAGWQVDRTAAEAGATGLVESLRASGDLDGRRVLFPASSMARHVLVDGLAGLGAEVVRVEAYRTEPGLADLDRVERDLANGGVDCLTFTSPSAVAGMVAGLGRERFLALLGECAVAVIGPTTAMALAGCGARRLETAAGATLEALVAAVIKSLEE
jgi:uroporphyrinogen-III synthase